MSYNTLQQDQRICDSRVCFLNSCKCCELANLPPGVGKFAYAVGQIRTYDDIAHNYISLFDIQNHRLLSCAKMNWEFVQTLAYEFISSSNYVKAHEGLLA